jgi:predicted DNA-binding transcriptional regulator AlpA
VPLSRFRYLVNSKANGTYVAQHRSVGKISWNLESHNQGFDMSRKGKKKLDAVGPADIAVLNVKELEALLKIDQKTIYRYVALGLIPYVRIQSNIRFVKQQIIGWSIKS